MLSGQAFEAGPAVDWLSGQMAACRREGFPWLRVAVDTSWALRPVRGQAGPAPVRGSVRLDLVGLSRPGRLDRRP
jgi:hypothetical protein